MQISQPTGHRPERNDNMKNRTKEIVIADIILYFKDNEDVFNDCMEELDGYNGYLGDDRYYYMQDLSEFYHGQDPIEILTPFPAYGLSFG